MILTGGAFISSRGLNVHNCIIWGNSAENEVFIFDDSSQTISIRNTCASEGIIDGVNGCIIADPTFVDAPNGIYRLASNSPCIDMGNDSYQSTSADVESQPRLLDGNADDIAHIDIGAYEFLSDDVDTDTDGVSDWKEYIADTDVKDPDSFFKIENITYTNGGMSVSFYASIKRIYTVQFCENLSTGGWGDLLGLTQLSDLEGLCELADLNSAQNIGFYKVKVELP